MKIIDVSSGQELHEGDLIPYSPEKRIIKVQEGLLDASAVMEYVTDGSYPTYPGNMPYHKGERYTQPLIVRFTHPSFFGQKVGFYPS